MPKKLTTEQFVERSKAKYGDALDYSKCVYTGGRHRVVLFCKKHQQEFAVEPNSHLTRECQGLQHFYPRDGFGGEERLKIQIQKDTLKYSLCKKHGIEIIYFVDRGYNVKQEYIGRIFNNINEMTEYLISKRNVFIPH